jgi:RimJ/RimL family protein N-acetyltransferase
MNWIEHPVVLEGKRVKLVPLESAHFPALLDLAKDQRIWEYMTVQGGDPEKLQQHLKSTLVKRAAGEWYTFTVIDKETGKVAGSTMFHNIFPEHRKLEIGWTWYAPEYWATGFNTECKLLLLTYCFEKLKTVRVQFQANDQNLRSRKAIEKIGGKFEGLLRKERIRPDGGFRTTAMYSIIDDEWAETKARLVQLLGQ